MKNTKTVTLILCALFTALSAVLSQISIPIGPVPINMTHISIFLAAGLLGAKYGAISQLVFVLLGLVGVPVFSGFTGGIQKLVGPTGGFIVGYIACAFVIGLLIDRFGSSAKALVLSIYAGWLVTYVLGVIWFMILTKNSLTASLFTCVLPFLPGDVVKTVLCVVLLNKLRPIFQKKFRSAVSV